MGLTDMIIMEDDTLKYIIENYTAESGVRKLKEILFEIVGELNLDILKNFDTQYEIPIKITIDDVKTKFFKDKQETKIQKIHNESKIGIINGLWANSLGQGGVLQIESTLIPTKELMTVKATGSLGEVIKESIDVALSVAWNKLDESTKNIWMTKWIKTPECFHIHCPDGSTPKDGPSAGGAITTCLISLLTGTKVNNQMAMTGEINLKGHITAIGGLEEKMFGAKKAGAKLVLCPRENSKDLDEIIEKFPNLFDRDFQAKLVDNIWDILGEVIIEPIDWVRFD
jgi:ATP-dependent Lon protease